MKVSGKFWSVQPRSEHHTNKTNMKKLIIPTILLLAVALVALGQSLNEISWRQMPERSVTVNAARNNALSNLWVFVDAQATNTRLNYLVIRKVIGSNVWTLDAGEDKVVKLVEVP